MKHLHLAHAPSDQSMSLVNNVALQLRTVVNVITPPIILYFQPSYRRAKTTFATDFQATLLSVSNSGVARTCCEEGQSWKVGHVVKKVKVPILVYIERKGPELISDSRQSACR